MSNPLIDELFEATVIPKVEIGLPTRGAFYPKGEVLSEDANPDEITVAPLSVLDESSFRDPLMMITGKAVSKLIDRVCPGVAEPGELCEIDVQAILIACRIASYGPNMQIEHICGKCAHPNVLEIDLNEHILRFTPYTEEEFEQFEITLSKLGHQVRIQPIRYADSVSMMLETIRTSREAQQFADSVDDNANLSDDFLKVYSDTFERTLRTNIEAIVASILVIYTAKGEPVRDRQSIRDYVAMLPANLLKEITDQIGLINKAIRERSMIEYQCDSCKDTIQVQVELDPQKLFTQAEGSEPEKKPSAKSRSTGRRGKTQSRVSRK